MRMNLRFRLKLFLIIFAAAAGLSAQPLFDTLYAFTLKTDSLFHIKNNDTLLITVNSVPFFTGNNTQASKLNKFAEENYTNDYKAVHKRLSEKIDSIFAAGGPAPDFFLYLFSVDVVYMNSRIVSFLNTEFLNEGGLSGKFYVMAKHAEPATGFPLSIYYFIKKNKLNEFRQVAEREFRNRYCNGDQTSTFTDLGFNFRNDNFYYPVSFIVTPEGIDFNYNEGEVAPPEMGLCEFFIPMELVRDLFHENAPVR